MLHKSFIDLEAVQELNAWADSITKPKKPTTDGSSGSWSLAELENVPSVVNVVRSKCLGIAGECFVEPMFRDFINETLLGRHVHRHTDPTVGEYKHIRYNILLRKPKAGGVLYHDDIEIPMDEGDLYILDTAKWHGITMVTEGKLYRSIVFGFLIP